MDDQNGEANPHNEEENEVESDEEDDKLSLSLGSASYSSQISSSMTSSLHLARSSPSLSLSFSSSPPQLYQMINLYGSQVSRPPLTLSGFPPSLNQISPVIPTVPPVLNQETQINDQKPDQIENADVTEPPPYPWATSKRATVQSLENLVAKGITTITGEVECKRCDKKYQVSYNLRDKFEEVENIIRGKKRFMRNRAPIFWTNPEPKRCELCAQVKCVKPVMPPRKREINWLFLLLGQTLGICTLEQLKNFCKHNKIHRTGAKDRVVYLTYMGLCKMLNPTDDLFNVD